MRIIGKIKISDKRPKIRVADAEIHGLGKYVFEALSKDVKDMENDWFKAYTSPAEKIPLADVNRIKKAIEKAKAINPKIQSLLEEFKKIYMSI